MTENARVAQDQDDYQKRYDGLVKRYDEVVAAVSAKETRHGNTGITDTRTRLALGCGRVSFFVKE